jgi:PleD family two-component response regulator
MRRIFIAIGFISTALLILAAVANACGDKFLVVGRGMRYGSAKHPAMVLIYSRNADQSKDLQSILKMAGHKVQVVSTEPQLHSAVNAAQYDLVLMELNDAVHLERQIEATAHKPRVLPVVYTENGLNDAASKYECILRGEKKNRNLVKVIDSAMEEKASGAPLKCEWSK